MKSTRIHFPVRGHLADANARHHHPAEKGSWIWHPSRGSAETAVLRFFREFELETARTITLHVTADQRFQLRCDGEDASFGPDRCDPEHWTVQTLELELEAGRHQLEARVWWIAEQDTFLSRIDGVVNDIPGPPMAQMTWRPGFLLYTEDLPPAQLNTGAADWKVVDLTDAVELFRQRIPHYFDVGPSFCFDLSRWSGGEEMPARMVMGPVQENQHGVRRPGWCLRAAMLPEQRRRWISGGRIRALRTHLETAAFLEEETGGLEAWQALIDGEELKIEAGAELTVIWDLKHYRCGYASLETAGGAGSRIEFDWAEALYEAACTDEVGHATSKGQRDEVVGKSFLGYGDRWTLAGESGELPTLWWRAGRFVRLQISVGDEPLVLKKLGVLETGYPLDLAAAWNSSDAEWDGLIPLFDNSFRCSAHETWTDSPYYEQLSYVGDDRLHMLSNYLGYGDDRMSRCALLNFAWSSAASGLVAERYPSAWRQESLTYSMLWPMMLRDFMMWRDDMDFVKKLLPELRSLMAVTEGLDHEGPLMTARNGWPFIDWVTEWTEGCGPGVREGDSSLVNLHWVLSMQAAAEVEAVCGEAVYAGHWREKARKVMEAVLDRYWDGDRGLLRDTVGDTLISEHAQFFALLTGLLSEEQTEGCLSALASDIPKARASIYASFYLLEALYVFGKAEAFHHRLTFWRKLVPQGFTATPEAPEPSRSDAHAWGSHPFFHSFASLAGIRSAAPGFRKVRISPLPGEMSEINCSAVHPRGLIRVRMNFSEGGVDAEVDLPGNAEGEFVWKGEKAVLRPGGNRIRLPSET